MIDPLSAGRAERELEALLARINDRYGEGSIREAILGYARQAHELGTAAQAAQTRALVEALERAEYAIQRAVTLGVANAEWFQDEADHVRAALPGAPPAGEPPA